MDCRIDPVPAFGLAPGDAVVLRNAGAQVSDDVLRSLRLARRNLGVDAVRVVGHTDCAAHGSDDEVAAAEVERGVVRIGVALPELEVRGAMLDLRSGARRQRVIGWMCDTDAVCTANAGGSWTNVELLGADLELRLPVGARARDDAAPAEDAERPCGGRARRSRGTRAGTARAGRRAPSGPPPGSPMRSSAGIPIATGGWCIATIVGASLSASRAASQATSSLPSSRPGCVVSHAIRRRPPTSAVSVAPKCARSASRSSWLPGITCTGIGSGASSSRMRSYSSARAVLGEVAGDQHRVRQRRQVEHRPHGRGQRRRGVVVLDVRVAELGEHPAADPIVGA